MKKSLLLLPLLLTLGAVSLSYGDDDDAGGSWMGFGGHRNGVAPVQDTTYKKECGACHFPYQPGWLPHSAWKRLLSAAALAEHFGENAELAEATRLHLLDYAVNNAADTSPYRRSQQVVRSMGGAETPLRITDSVYIRRKHHEIPAAVLKSDQVKSLSACDACHTQAAQGVFDEDTVVIPGRGRW